MPNAKTHLLIGAAVGAIVNGVTQIDHMRHDPFSKFDWGEFLLCTAASATASLIPDLLEPADSPNHRRFFHSLAMTALVAYAITGKHTRAWPAAKLLFLGIMALGYLSHLAADACTPRSIRFV